MTAMDAGGRPVIVGGGIAGLLTALHLAPEPAMLVTAGALGEGGSTALAQGGLAAALGEDDSPDLHLADTLAAGDGLGERQAAHLVTAAAPDALATLSRFGVRFDRAPDGRLCLGLEAAHGRRRIVHAGGDGTGREIVRALADAVRRTPGIAVLEHAEARRLVLRDGEVHGVLVACEGGAAVLSTRRVVIATGGIGGLFADSTNPPSCWGQGLMLAARAGAALADLEFIQFHPTALDGPGRPMPLVSEAVRGEGAVLVDETGARFMADIPGGELAPRDVVARAVAAHLGAGHRVFLDATRSLGPAFPKRFPAIARACRELGVDPSREPIPVRPAAHYHMGGIAVDEEGRSTVRGLWACGEAACTGLHGANRLASNSLIEAAVFARAVARSVSNEAARPARPCGDARLPHRGDPDAVRPAVSRALGVVRQGGEMRAALAGFGPLAARDDAAALALMIAVAACRRRESRGAHFRTDFPHRTVFARHSSLTLGEALAAAAAIAEDTPAEIVSA